MSMGSSQIIKFSEKISEQKNGIILCWQEYDVATTTVIGSGHNYFFVPKSHTQFNLGQGVSNWCNTASYFCCKYVYIEDQAARGHDKNIQTGTTNGITWDARRFVLTKVLGV